jgi:hypothetical protein
MMILTSQFRRSTLITYPNLESIKPTQIHTLSTEQDIPTFTLQDFESFEYMTLAKSSKTT